MWCRALLFIVALTCTLQSEIIADNDDLLCVIILSGLQKDDLDGKLVEKLQRHNVNIDDLNNRKNIEKCNLRSDSHKVNTNEAINNTEGYKNEQYDQTSSMMINNVHESIEIEDKSKGEKHNNYINVSNKEDKSYLELPVSMSYENLVKLWITLNKTSYNNNEVKTTTEAVNRLTLKISLSSKKDSRNNDLEPNIEFINKILKKYKFITTSTTEAVPQTTTSRNHRNQMDIVSQQILEFLKQNNVTKNKSVADYKSAESQSKITIIRNHNTTEKIKKICKNDETTPNLKSELKKSIHESTLRNNNLDNFVKVWTKSNKKIDHANTDEDTKDDSQAIDLNLIHSMLSNYYSEGPITTVKPIKTIAHRIMKYQKDDQNETVIDCVFQETYKNDGGADTNNIFHETSQTQNIDLLIKKLLALKHNINTSALLPHHSENKMENNLTTPDSKTDVIDRVTTISNIDQDTGSQYIEALEAYMATKHVQTTEQPTTTPKYIDVILEQFKKILESNGTSNLKNSDNNTPEDLQDKYLNKTLQYNKDDDILSHKSPSEVYGQDQLIKPLLFQANFTDEKLNQPQNIQEKNDIHTQQEAFIMNNKTKTDGYSKDLNQVFQMFETFITAKNRKAEPNMTPKNINIVAQKIKQYLENNDNKHRKSIVSQVPPQEQILQTDIYKPGPKLLVTRKFQDINKKKSQAKQLKLVGSSNNVPSKNVPKNSKINQKQNKIKQYNDTAKTDIKLLPDEIIRDITEKVKASLMKDLQKQISSTLRSVNISEFPAGISFTAEVVNWNHSSTPLPKFLKHETTGVPTNDTLDIDSSNMQKSTTALKNLIHLCKQFEYVKNSIKIKKNKQRLARNGKTKNEFHGPVNMVYPNLLPINYAYNFNRTQISNMPIFLDPYGYQGITNPEVPQTKITNEVKKIQYSVDPRYTMQSKMEHSIQASVIQTDDAQVPLLGIPVPKSVSPINQNIIVTTKYPMIPFKDEIEHKSKTTTRKPRHVDLIDHIKYNTDQDRPSDSDNGRLPNTDLERRAIADIARFKSFGHGHKDWRARYHIPDYLKRFNRDSDTPRDKQANFHHDNFYKEYLSNTKPKGTLWDFPEYSQEHHKDRFQVKFEEPDAWQPHRNNYRLPKKEKQINVVSRQQLSINNYKKKKPDDTHFINFLKSQKKVNEMLEKILKSNDNVKSVEAI